MEPNTVNTRRRLGCSDADATKPAEYGSTGADDPDGQRPAGCKGKLMLDKSKSRLQPSTRSSVPPFMVMDVMTAAARLEAQGRRA